jgi:DNA repair protein RadC
MPERPRPRPRPEHLQTTFLAPDDAVLFAELTRIRVLIAELTARYDSRVRGPDGAPVIIHSPKDVANLLMPEMQELPHEEFRTMLLNSKNGVIDIVTQYKGTLNSSPVRVAEVYKPAILANAASIIPVHCHPSGDPTPSPEDVRVTAEIVKAGQLLDIECLDHIIIGRGRYASLKERGLGF